MKNKIIFKTLMLKGEAGSTIVSMEKTGHVGTADIYTITFNDGSTTEISLENMSAITSVEKTSSTDTEDIYTITCADGSTQTFSVLNHNEDIAAMSSDLSEMADEISAIDARVDGFVTPEMFGAKGDGVADDTNAIQSAFDSGKIIFIPNGTYAISQPIEIKHDVHVVCDAQCQIKPIANMDALVKVGVTIDDFTNPVFTGLVKVLWNGGTLWGANAGYVVTDVIYTEKTYHCKFTNVTVVNVTTNGIHIAGAIGAYCLFDNCVVRGIHGNGQRGFFIERSDQIITNCSVVDCLHGFETNANSVLFDKCTAWMSTDTNWTNTICFYLGGAFNRITNCIIDTMFYGIRFKSDFKYGSASNINWINNYDVVADSTTMSLLSTDDPSSGYLVNFPVEGLVVGTLLNTAYIKRDLASAYHTFVNNIVAKTPAQIADLFGAAVYKENRTYSTYGSGTNKLMKTNYGLKFIHDSMLNSVAGGTVIDIAPNWNFPALSGALPVTAINNNSGDELNNVALYCNNKKLQLLLHGSTTYNLKVHIELDVEQYSI